MSKELFDTRSIDEGTKILSAEYCCRDGYHTLIESWLWDGIRGKSLILLAEQVQEKDDLFIRNLACEWLGLEDSKDITLKRSERFVYFNFGFKS